MIELNIIVIPKIFIWHEIAYNIFTFKKMMEVYVTEIIPYQ